MPFTFYPLCNSTGLHRHVYMYHIREPVPGKVLAYILFISRIVFPVIDHFINDLYTGAFKGKKYNYLFKIAVVGYYNLTFIYRN